MLPVGSFYVEIGWVATVPASILSCVAMARERIVLFILDGSNSKIVARGLWRDCPFGHIFGDCVIRMGYNVAVTRFFQRNALVRWASTPGDINLVDGGRINVVSFGWLFTVADLSEFDWWGEFPSLDRGVFSG